MRPQKPDPFRQGAGRPPLRPATQAARCERGPANPAPAPCAAKLESGNADARFLLDRLPHRGAPLKWPGNGRTF
jgi:hypothetical protein